MILLILCVGVAASNSPIGRYNNAVTTVNDIRKKIDSLKANDPEVSSYYSNPYIKCHVQPRPLC